MVVGGNRHSRMIVEECMKWAMQRQVFGKALIQQPVIRFKLGQMIADVEAVHSMLEDMTYQMCTMTEGELNAHLAGPISLLKYLLRLGSRRSAISIWPNGNVFPVCFPCVFCT